MNRREMLAKALDTARRNGICEDEGFKLDEEPTRVAYGMSGHYTVDELAMILDDLRHVQSQYAHLCEAAAREAQQRKAVAEAAEKGRAAVAAVIGDRKPSRIYVGRNQGCRCGCGGNYHDAGAPAFKGAMTRLERMVGLGEAKQDSDVDSSYVNFTYGDNRAVTVYFDTGAK